MVVSNDVQQFFVEDRVARAIDLSGVFFKQGRVVEVYTSMPGVGTPSYYLYAIVWDAAPMVVERGYFGSGLRKLDTEAELGLPARREV